jgi:ribosome-associated protein
MVARAAIEKKASKATLLGVGEFLGVVDVFVILTARSDRHARTVLQAVEEAMDRLGRRASGIEGREEAEWILADYGDVAVHVFQDEARRHFDLERLWGDAPRIHLSDEEGLS